MCIRDSTSAFLPVRSNIKLFSVFQIPRGNPAGMGAEPPYAFSAAISPGTPMLRTTASFAMRLIMPDRALPAPTSQNSVSYTHLTLPA
ncbi:hypothetical protein OO18_29460, partial [Raoultella ornithinolytica]